jgi:hypothetical protein
MLVVKKGHQIGRCLHVRMSRKNPVAVASCAGVSAAEYVSQSLPVSSYTKCTRLFSARLIFPIPIRPKKLSMQFKVASFDE